MARSLGSLCFALVNSWGQACCESHPGEQARAHRQGRSPCSLVLTSSLEPCGSLDSDYSRPGTKTMLCVCIGSNRFKRAGMGIGQSCRAGGGGEQVPSLPRAPGKAATSTFQKTDMI